MAQRVFLLLLAGALLTGLCKTAQAQAAEWFVDDDNNSGTEDGSARHPFDTIGEAVDAAGTGAIVRVAAGTYAENVRIRDKTVELRGGYAGGSAAGYAAGTGGDFGEQDTASHVAHIRGDGTDAAVSLIRAGTSVLDGFRITGGTGSVEGLPWAATGGGVYVEGGAPTISHNTIEDNDSRRAEVASIDDTSGGGVYAADADLTLVDNLIRNNTSGRGAGAAVFGGSAIIRRNTIEGNVGQSDHGGGLEIGTPTTEITHNLIRNNEIGRDLGYGWGGGVSFFGQGNRATLAHNTVTGNTAPTAGSGTFIDDGAEAVLAHELIYGNGCPEIGGAGVYVDGGDGVRSKATLIHVTVADHPCPDNQGGNGVLVDVLSDAAVTNALFWGNGGDDFFVVDPASTLSVSYTLSEEAVPGTGNRSADPLFADPAAGDYHVRSTTGRWDPAAEAWTTDATDSPAIDAGDPASSHADEPAPNGERANLGAYGNTPEASLSAVGSAATPGETAPSGFALDPVYPNPFHAVAVIGYALPASGHVTLRVFDLLGRPVATLVDGPQPVGRHRARFDAAALPAGTYLCRIEAGPFTALRTIVLAQ